MSKKMKQVMSIFLVFAMVFQLALPMSVRAAEVAPEKGFTIEHVGTGKLIKTYDEANAPLTVDGEEGDPATVFSKAIFGANDTNAINNPALPVVTFISKAYGKRIKSVFWNDGAQSTTVMVENGDNLGGWESLQIVPNGDGTVSFKDSYYDKYITVADVDGKTCLQCMSDVTKDTLTDNEKFIIHTDVVPEAINDLSVDAKSRTQTTLDLTWTKPEGFYTGVQLFQKGPADLDYTKIADLTDETSYQATGLTAGSPYSYKLLVINGNGSATDTNISTFSNEASASTRAGAKPAIPSNVKIEEKSGNTLAISWDAAENATHYQVLRAESMFGEYVLVDTVDKDKTSVDVEYTGDKYANYYRIVALNNGTAGDEDFSDAEVSEQSDYASLEKEMFDDHTLVFAPTDDVKKIDDTLETIFKAANDANVDAQFNGEHWQIYFKPGDYTKTSCIDLGFYTSINGLGKTPYDVKLNNIAIPAYLAGNNATCNFWRSTENVSIINTGNEQGAAQYGSWRPEWFNWGVAQAAPLRRVYSERPIAYDWNYGWASGGYVADSYISGIDGEGNGAGTWSGQQFYTRNTKIDGNAFGTTLNNFFQGVEAPNLPNADGVDKGTARTLQNGNGYSNWKIPNEKNEQQVFTNVETTPEIAEKPFLYLDADGEYQVFVPAVRKNTKGTSWSEDDMGEGKSIPLDEFYIARPDDTAKEINAQLAAGKNIYFTPGVYHAEEPIKVTNPDTILLGTGMATIIPDNEDAAMRVADVDGVRLAGLIFDAGINSKYLLVVGDQGADKDHAKDPTILQDLFFRVGGTTDVLTKSNDALEINSNNVLCDHFWIWRADHGAGVKWYGNESKHGLIVNGDNVTCYALFNEHFQEYNTLWNGENGATYFYQNETCYDPISQDAWMSHNGTINGYASYKVADQVNNHYAVGLGVYNVFIYTGPTYDSTEVQIQLDNAIEVPDKEGVLVENACLQTFADEEKVLQKINSIVNGKGDPVSSGTDPVTGEKGTAWDRSFLLYYRNGETEGSSRAVRDAYNELISNYDKYKDTTKTDDILDEDWNKFQESLREVEDLLAKGFPVSVKLPADETIEEYTQTTAVLKDAEMNLNVSDAELTTAKQALQNAITAAQELSKENYSDSSWETFETALTAAKALGDDAKYSEIINATDALTNAQKALVTQDSQLASAKKVLTDTIAAAEKLNAGDYTEETNKPFVEALEEAKELVKATDTTADAMKAAAEKLKDAQKALVLVTSAQIEAAKEELANAIAGVADLKEEDYTEESWADFAASQKAAKTTLAKEEVTLKELTDAIKALEEAKEALVIKTPEPTEAEKELEAAKTELANVVKEAEKLNKDNYTADSWETFEKALTATKAVAAKVDATLDEITVATKALKEAQNKLVKVAGTTPDTTTPDVKTPNSTKPVETTPGGTTSAGTTQDSTTSGSTTAGDTVVTPSVKLNATSIPLQKGKTTKALKVIEKVPENDTVATWTSSNKKIVTVNKSGKIKAKKIGTAYVTVTMKSGATTKCKVKVQKEKVTTKKLVSTSKDVNIKVKEKVQLKVERNPITATEKIKWSSSNKKVVTVNKKGQVTGKKAGSATITAKTTNGKKLKFKVTVSK